MFCRGRRISGADRARRLVGQRGQAATEYMMVIAVFVVAVIFATSPFVDPAGPFQRTMKQLSKEIGSIIASPTSPLLPGPGGR